MYTIECSVGRAHKLMQRLKEALNGSGGFSNTRLSRMMLRHRGGGDAVLPVEVPASASTTRLYDRMMERAETEIARRDRARLLDHGYRKIKEAIFSANQLHGISALLSEQAHVKSRISNLNNLISDVENAPAKALSVDEVSHADIDDHKATAEESEGGSVTLPVLLYNVDDLRSERQMLRRQAAEIDDNIRRLNANTEISVEVPDEVAEELGLL